MAPQNPLPRVTRSARRKFLREQRRRVSVILGQIRSGLTAYLTRLKWPPSSTNCFKAFASAFASFSDSLGGAVTLSVVLSRLAANAFAAPAGGSIGAAALLET